MSETSYEDRLENAAIQMYAAFAAKGVSDSGLRKLASHCIDLATAFLLELDLHLEKQKDAAKEASKK